MLELPKEVGYYVVVTETLKGNNNAFKCFFNGKSFECSNQQVIKWICLDF